MAILYIAEFPNMALGATRGNVEVVPMPPIAEQTVAIQATPALNSQPLSAATNVIRIACDAVCSIVISRGKPPAGAPPAATTAHFRIQPGPPEYLSVQPGSVISVIANT